jgi:hypothetical protein
MRSLGGRDFDLSPFLHKLLKEVVPLLLGDRQRT